MRNSACRIFCHYSRMGEDDFKREVPLSFISPCCASALGFVAVVC